MAGVMQLAEYRHRKLQEMQALHLRFKQVLQTKEESHAATRAQLEAAQQQAKQYQTLLSNSVFSLSQLTASETPPTCEAPKI